MIKNKITPKATKRINAANNFGTSSRLPASIILHAKPVEVPDPATNSATTDPIKAKPIDVFIPVRINGKA